MILAGIVNGLFFVIVFAVVVGAVIWLYKNTVVEDEDGSKEPLFEDEEITPAPKRTPPADTRKRKYKKRDDGRYENEDGDIVDELLGWMLLVELFDDEQPPQEEPPFEVKEESDAETDNDSFEFEEEPESKPVQSDPEPAPLAEADDDSRRNPPPAYEPPSYEDNSSSSSYDSGDSGSFGD